MVKVHSFLQIVFSFIDTILYHHIYIFQQTWKSFPHCLTDYGFRDCTSHDTDLSKFVLTICTEVPGETGSCCAKDEIK